MPESTHCNEDRLLSRQLEFKITYLLASPKNPWIYGRGQWHKLLRFASKIRKPVGSVSLLVRLTVLDLCLSYMCADGGHRFLTGIPDEAGETALLFT